MNEITMEGIPLVWFVQKPVDTLVCSLCYGVFCKPKQCPNKHIFCEQCLYKAVENQGKCPLCRYELSVDLCLEETGLSTKIDSLEVFCIPSDSTVVQYNTVCQWKGPFGCRKEHALSGCPCSIIACETEGCDVKFLGHFKSMHKCKTECE
jgi:hypothetical protein